MRLLTQKTQAPLALGLLLPLVVIAKEWPIIANPRFWAEEGLLYAKFRTEGVASALSYVHLGSYQLLDDLFVWLSTFVPLPLAPVVTVWLGWLLLVVLGLQAAAMARAWRLPIVVSALLLTAIAMLWTGFEVSLSATNAQWIAGVSVLLVLALPAEAIARRPKLICGWLLICGLSGIPAVLSAPAFALRWVLERRRVLGFCLVALLLAAAAQAAMVLSHPTGPRPFSINLAHLVAAAIEQTVVGPLLGRDLSLRFGQAVLRGGWKGLAAVAAAVIACAVLGVVALRARDGRPAVLALLLSWPAVTLVQSVAALGDPGEHLTGSGNRYFFYGAVCFCLVLALLARSRSRPLALASAAALAIVTAAGVTDRLTHPETAFFLQGPSWSAAARACGSARPCDLPLWPAPWKTVVTD